MTTDEVSLQTLVNAKLETISEQIKGVRDQNTSNIEVVKAMLGDLKAQMQAMDTTRGDQIRANAQRIDALQRAHDRMVGAIKLAVFVLPFAMSVIALIASWVMTR